MLMAGLHYYPFFRRLQASQTKGRSTRIGLSSSGMRGTGFDTRPAGGFAGKSLIWLDFFSDISDSACARFHPAVGRG